MSYLAPSASFEYICYGSTVIIINCFNSFSAGTVFRRQNLTSIDVRFRRLKTVPALKGSSYMHWIVMKMTIIIICCHSVISPMELL